MTSTKATFRAWLKAQIDRDDPVADLAQDVRADSCMTGRTPASIRRHMETAHGASAEALAALDRAALEWQTNQDRTNP